MQLPGLKTIMTGALVGAVLVACDSGTQSADRHSDAPMGTILYDESEILARVNGAAITRDDLERHIRRQKASTTNVQQDPNPEKALEDLIRIELVYQAALREDLQKRAEVKDEMARRAKEFLAEVYLLDLQEGTEFTDDDLRAEYERELERTTHQYKARHLTRESHEEAEAAIAELDAGADFLTLAEDNITDPSSPPGGDLGWSMLPSMHRSIADALESMEVGEHSSEPVQTQFAWHVLLLEDKRPVTVQPPEFEAVKESARISLTSRTYQAHLKELKENAKIERLAAP